LTRKATTPFCAIWDTDIIIPAEQIEASVKMLREGADFIYPYTDLCLDVPRIVKEHYFESGDIRILTQNQRKMSQMYPHPVGGAFLANRSSYMEAGMENENYYGWGREDGDRYNRWRQLGFQIRRVAGALFHLSHERGLNSSYQDMSQREIKTTELIRIASMSTEELKKELASWK